jgi:predicted PurR-regulated permease PerM
LIVIGSVVLVIAALYWAQTVVIPVAVAFMLTFVLGPLVNVIQRAGLRRVPAVILTVLFAIALIGGTTVAIVVELNHLLAELPKHQTTIARKVSRLREAGTGSMWQNIQIVLRSVEQKEETAASRDPDGMPLPPAAEQPISVRVEPSSFARLQSTIGPVAEVLANIGLVIVLLTFMLIQREDLRNRVVRLVGQHGLVSTTRAIDEATRRISRFLVSQVLINASFGVILSLSLFVIGVPYAFLWGTITAILRFIPYLGTWAAAALIFGFTVMSFPGWMPTLYAMGVFGILEICTANIVEPLVFGHSTGISTVALVVAAAFWTWLWGPIGLVLSTPLTACMVVLGKYVSNLQFFDVLLGDEPVLDREIRFYQRLLAHDHDEAADLVEEYIAEKPVEGVYDELLLPALHFAKRDRETGELGAADEEFILRSIRDILEEVAPAQLQATEEHERQTKPALNDVPARACVCIIGCPARDQEDELALQMFRLMTEASGFTMEVLSSTMLTAEVIARVGQEEIALVCVGALPPGGMAKTRYLCKRLRLEYPRLPILVGHWGPYENVNRGIQRLQSAGATHVATSLLELRNYAIPLLQALSHTTEPLTQAQTA